MTGVITAGEKVTSTRMNECLEYRRTYLSQFGLASTGAGAKTSSVTVGYLAIPSLAYPSRVTVHANCAGTMAASGDWEIMLGWDTSSDPTDSSTTQPASSLSQKYLNNVTAVDQKVSAPMSMVFTLSANTAAWVRVFAKRTAGTFTLQDPYGATLAVDRLELYS